LASYCLVGVISRTLIGLLAPESPRPTTCSYACRAHLVGVLNVIVYRRVIHLAGNQHRENHRTSTSRQVHSPCPVCRRKYQLKLSILLQIHARLAITRGIPVFFGYRMTVNFYAKFLNTILEAKKHG